ncbi:MAG TPA: hypothetical protein VKE74_19585, partial [Gemmataceae bacterium]|nr:hypothetical protein [Gemmataceae bacterium]
MRSCRAGLSAAVMVLALAAGTASAQPPAQPREPTGNPPRGNFDGFFYFTPDTGTLTGGGYDVQFGYWVRGGPSDSPSPVWPGPAYTPFSASPYGLGHPVGTGF